MYEITRAQWQKKQNNVSNALQLCVICAGKQQRSYFRNEAIKQIQNEHNPLVNQHMAMSFACLWITNLWGEFLQMEFSMPCTLCFKPSKQTNKSIMGPELPSSRHPPPRSVCQVTDSWLMEAEKGRDRALAWKTIDAASSDEITWKSTVTKHTHTHKTKIWSLVQLSFLFVFGCN